jgi:hypothetical protein
MPSSTGRLVRPSATETFMNAAHRSSPGGTRASARPPRYHRAAALPALCSALLLAACAIEPRQDTARGETVADADHWLAGTTVDQRNRAIERQFAGFSQTMWEVGYRYTELYYAIRERNWELAGYHADKIGDAVERGIERRPARGGNARLMLLEQELPALQGAIELEDAEAAEVRFDMLTASCNTCHEAEDVAFIRVAPPQRRLAPLTPPNNAN